MLGRVYEYFLGNFASKEGKNAGETVLVAIDIAPLPPMKHAPTGCRLDKVVPPLGYETRVLGVKTVVKPVSWTLPSTHST